MFRFEGMGMHRWAWRGTLAVAALTLMLGGLVGIRAFSRACDGSLEGLRYLASVRAQLASATAPPPAPSQPTPTPMPSQAQVSPSQPAPTPVPPPPPTVAQRVREAAGVAGDAALVAVIQVKQHDAVAYPAHMGAARALDAAGCGKDAVRLQWIKAGLHASTDGQIERIATALVESASGPEDLADLRRVVRTWTERAPESDSLPRVLAALDDQST